MLRYGLSVCFSALLSGCAFVYFGVDTPQSRLAAARISEIASSDGVILSAQAQQDFSKFLGLIQKRYYLEVDIEALIEDNLEAFRSSNATTSKQWLHQVKNRVVSTLDKHSAFYDATAYAQFLQSLSGEFIGIGVRLYPHSLGVRIEPLPDSPAQRAGLQSNDIIIKVGSNVLAGQSLSQIAEQLRGLRGTSVSLQVQRNVDTPDQQEFSVSLTRQRIRQSLYQAEIRDNIGYIQLSRFSATTEDDLRGVFKNWQDQMLTGIILDLRQNGGGYFDQAVKVADMFLESGEIVLVHERDDSTNWQARPNNDVAQTYPMVILVDEFTASSSEIVAEAMQVHERAMIIGMPTYGKGTVQSLFGLSGGEGIKLTTARYQSPSGRFMVGTGVIPQMMLTDDPLTPEDELWIHAKAYLQSE